MDAYIGFAKLYDLFMDNIDYDAWGKYLSTLLQEYGIKNGILLNSKLQVLLLKIVNLFSGN